MLLYQAQTVAPTGQLSHGRDLQRPSFLFFIKVFYCMAPDAGSLLHGYVTAISKSAEKRLETIKQLAIGACGLRVWKVAQLVER